MPKSKNNLKSVSMLNGHLILRDHKTGVHYFHEIITKKISSMNRNYNLKVSFFDHNNKYSNQLEKKENAWLRPFVDVCTKWPRIFSYLLPIELFFGENDLYFCDGLFPITFVKSKKVCLVHDMMVKIFPENYSFIKKVYLELFFKKLRKADLIIAVSETTKKDIVKYYNIDPDKIIVCYNGVDSKIKNAKKLDNNYINLSKKYLLYVGDMRKNKNLLNTIKGFLCFCEKYNINDLYFYIAGKKNGEYQVIKDELNKSNYGDKVKFLGYISDNDKDLLYQNCLAVVLLSLYEGFGMPIVEGMSYYKPVITSNCSSMKEVGEGAARLADPQNIVDISKAIADIYTKKFKVNKSIYDSKLKKYNFDNVADIINNAIEKCLYEK